MPRNPRANSPDLLKAIDLFAGCGGLTTGLKLAGFRVLAAVECDRGAVEAYRANHDEVRVYHDDIRRLNGPAILADLQLRTGELDLLAGCPPCQGFSRIRTLNNGRAVHDARNDLVHEYLRLVRELRPRALLFENVPGLINDPRYTALRHALIDLEYNLADDVHDAADFGVAQRRLRLIMLGARGARIAMPHGANESQATVRSVIGSLPVPGTSGDPAHDVSENRSPEIRALIRAVPSDGGSRSDLPERLRLPCHIRCAGFFDVYGRMRWDDVAPTITTGFVNPSKGRFLHPRQHRCITPREAALLQSFPPDYRFPMQQGKYPIARMIGNAFPPELARQHAAAIANTLRNTRPASRRRQGTTIKRSAGDVRAADESR